MNQKRCVGADLS